MSTKFFCDRCDMDLKSQPPCGLSLILYDKDGKVYEHTDADLCKTCYADAVTFMSGEIVGDPFVITKGKARKVKPVKTRVLIAGVPIAKCERHPRYTGKYHPRTKCGPCNALYEARHE